MIDELEMSVQSSTSGYFPLLHASLTVVAEQIAQTAATPGFDNIVD
jgi:hypothetical protein